MAAPPRSTTAGERRATSPATRARTASVSRISRANASVVFINPALLMRCTSNCTAPANPAAAPNSADDTERRQGTIPRRAQRFEVVLEKLRRLVHTSNLSRTTGIRTPEHPRKHADAEQLLNRYSTVIIARHGGRSTGLRERSNRPVGCASAARFPRRPPAAVSKGREQSSRAFAVGCAQRTRRERISARPT